MINADVLKNKNTLNPEVLTQLREMKATYRPQRVKLVANLPYAVATPVISNLLIAGIDLERMIVTVQWEIAEKMIARPAHEGIRGTRVFWCRAWPTWRCCARCRPAVFGRSRRSIRASCKHSAERRETRHGCRTCSGFRNFLRDLYSHRRKNLRGGIISMTGRQHEKAIVDAKLAELGYAGTECAETLSIAQHVQLCEAFRSD